MKQLRYFSLCVLLHFFGSLLHAADPSDIHFLKRTDAPSASGQHFLLTYARSGTNLTSCYLQYFTGKPIKFLFDETTFLAENRLKVPIDYSKLVLYRTHYPKDLKKINNQTNKLLYILRNYKESLYRHNYDQFHSPEDFEVQFTKNKVMVREYMEGLETYDRWEPSLRLLIHYEDLLTDPVNIVATILNFFDEPIPAHLTAELLKEISAKALTSYDKQHKGVGGSQSKGEDLFYHTRNFPQNILRAIDAAVEKNYPVLWNNYLNKYKS